MGVLLRVFACGDAGGYNVIAIVIRGTSGQSLETFKQSRAVSDIGEHWTEKYYRTV